MYQIDLEAIKSKIDILIQTALSGEEVIITRNDAPILKLVSISHSPLRRKAGTAKSKMTISDDFDEPLEEFREYTV